MSDWLNWIELKNVFSSVRFLYFMQNRLPFNWRTPFGYAIALCLQAIGTYCTSADGIPVVCSMIGCCWLLKTFVQDITHDLAQFVANDIFQGSFDRSETMEHFTNVVKSFTIVKQLSFLAFFMNSVQHRLELKRKLNDNFFIKSDRLVDEFNANFQIFISGIYVWIRVTVWASIITLIYELVEYFFKPIDVIRSRDHLKNNWSF